MSMYSIADVDDDKVCDSEDRGASHEQGMLVILKFSVACLKLAYWTAHYGLLVHPLVLPCFPAQIHVYAPHTTLTS